ncbi:hypothetical protein [Prosthecobacter sp.]|jgi:hypothetical protein
MPATLAKPNTRTVLNQLDALSFASLEKLMPQIAALRAKKHPLVMSKRATWLKKKIEAGLPAGTWDEYRRLIEKRDAGGLNAQQQQRVEALADVLEQHRAEWLGWAMELSRLRRMTLQGLMRSLNIQRPVHG